MNTEYAKNGNEKYIKTAGKTAAKYINIKQ